jgi:hypothetical protein
VRFKRRRGGRIESDVPATEVAVLARAVGELLELLAADDEQAAGADPLEALVGLTPGDVRRPDEPALRRLFPDAYRDDAFGRSPGRADPQAAAAEASADFRRYTEADLRAGKRANADVVLATLAPLAGGGRLALDRGQADAWLGTLNDLRLVLGVRLDVREDVLEQPFPDDDPRAFALEVFSWLGWLQETLLECVDPRSP